jgi:hypothetical protein
MQWWRVKTTGVKRGWREEKRGEEVDVRFVHGEDIKDEVRVSKERARLAA